MRLLIWGAGVILSQRILELIHDIKMARRAPSRANLADLKHIMEAIPYA